LTHIYREREAMVNQSLTLASYFIDQKAEARRKSETGHRVTSRLLTPDWLRASADPRRLPVRLSAVEGVSAR
jgi:hypothetical protein